MDKIKGFSLSDLALEDLAKGIVASELIDIRILLTVLTQQQTELLAHLKNTNIDDEEEKWMEFRAEKLGKAMEPLKSIIEENI